MIIKIIIFIWAKMAFANRFPPHRIGQCKRLAFEKLKHTGLDNNGTIFGGFVRDEYISEYYTDKFKREHNREDMNIGEYCERYWNEEFSPETKARILMPKDMDISFKTREEADKFINELRSIPEFSKIWITSSNTSEYSRCMQDSLESIQHISIDMHYGREPFLSRGRLIKIDIDIVVPINKNIEPPFDNLDMLCNGFILTKEGKRFSKNTGTIIDMYSDYERAVVTPQILRDMLNFKTYICMTNKYEKQTINISAFNSMIKMLT